MNGVDDDYEPAGQWNESEPEPQPEGRRMPARAASVCMGAAFLALPMAVVDPNGWWLPGAVIGGVLYMLLTHFSTMSRERGER